MKVLYIIGDYNQKMIENLQKQFEHRADRIDRFMYTTRKKKELPVVYGSDVMYNSNIRIRGTILVKLRFRNVLTAFLKMYNGSDAQYDILHAHMYSTDGILAYEYSRAHKTPFLVSIRNTDINAGFLRRSRFIREYQIKILLAAKAIVFPNVPYIEKLLCGLEEEIREVVAAKSVMIPNGIDKFWFENSTSKRTIVPNRECTILTVGVVNKNKNMLTVAKAIDLLNQKGYSIKYRIAGEHRNPIVVRELKRYKSTTLLGSLSKERLLEEYRAADIFVLVSKHETFGLCYAEALTQGLPIIYSRNEGFDGQYKDGVVGYGCEYNDVNELAKIITNILANYLDLSANAVICSKRYDWGIVSKLLRDLYTKSIDETIDLTADGKEGI